MEKTPTHLPKGECTITKVFYSKAGGITTTALVMSCWRSLPRVPPLCPSQNWLYLISAANMPRITTKTNRDPSYGLDPEAVTEGLLSISFGHPRTAVALSLM